MQRKFEAFMGSLTNISQYTTKISDLPNPNQHMTIEDINWVETVPILEGFTPTKC